MHRFSPRASPPNTKRPRDHQTCTNVAQFHFQDRSRRASSNTSLRSLISAIENARFTCHRSQALIPHAERRSRPQNGPATIGLALTLCRSIFRTVPQEPRATRSPKPHLRNQERTFHVLSLSRTTTIRRRERRRPLLDSTPSRGPQRDAPALGLAPVARPRPRARRRLAPRDTTDHSRRARLVPAAPAAVVSQHRPTAPRRRGRECLNASPAFTATTGRVRGCVSMT